MGKGVQDEWFECFVGALQRKDDPERCEGQYHQNRIVMRTTRRTIHVFDQCPLMPTEPSSATQCATINSQDGTHTTRNVATSQSLNSKNGAHRVSASGVPISSYDTVGICYPQSGLASSVPMPSRGKLTTARLSLFADSDLYASSHLNGTFGCTALG